MLPGPDNNLFIGTANVNNLAPNPIYNIPMMGTSLRDTGRFTPAGGWELLQVDMVEPYDPDAQ